MHGGVQWFLTGGIWETSGRNVNTTGMPQFLYLYPFCTAVSTRVNLLSISNYFQTSNYN